MIYWMKPLASISIIKTEAPIIAAAIVGIESGMGGAPKAE